MTKNSKRWVGLSIAAGIAFVVGFGIGVGLYAITNDAAQEGDRISITK